MSKPALSESVTLQNSGDEKKKEQVHGILYFLYVYLLM